MPRFRSISDEYLPHLSALKPGHFFVQAGNRPDKQLTGKPAIRSWNPVDKQGFNVCTQALGSLGYGDIVLLHPPLGTGAPLYFLPGQ